MSPIRKIRMLVAPLDWGLGHATRCIPIIKALIERGIEVIIASDGPQAALLSSEFPAISVITLPGYGIIYGSSAAGTLSRLLRQLPGFFRSLHREHGWLQEFCRTNQIDAIISDNRYGLYHPAIPSVIITHQLYIQTGVGNLANRLVFYWHMRQLRRFSACWIPDYTGHSAIAGILSNPPMAIPLPVFYIGPLAGSHPVAVTGDRIPLLIILSGPEPQRTVFEQILIEQLRQVSVKAVVIRGLPGATDIPWQGSANIERHNHLSRQEMFDRISRATYVIARCGYTTVMELMHLKKKGILVPTPGQPEQQYLARHLAKKKWMMTAAQENFSLTRLLDEAKAFTYIFPDMPQKGGLKVALDQLIQTIGIRTDA